MATIMPAYANGNDAAVTITPLVAMTSIVGFGSKSGFLRISEVMDSNTVELEKHSTFGGTMGAFVPNEINGTLKLSEDVVVGASVSGTGVYQLSAGHLLSTCFEKSLTWRVEVLYKRGAAPGKRYTYTGLVAEHGNGVTKPGVKAEVTLQLTQLVDDVTGVITANPLIEEVA